MLAVENIIYKGLYLLYYNFFIFLSRFRLLLCQIDTTLSITFWYQSKKKFNLSGVRCGFVVLCGG